MEKKLTKKEVLVAIKALAVEAKEKNIDYGHGVTNDDVIAYVDKTIAQMDAKAAKAKEYGAKKKAEGDVIYTAVIDAIAADPRTIDYITEEVKETVEDATRAKVIARLTKAVKEGKAFKAQVKVEGKKVIVYANEPIEVETAETETDAE